MNHCERCGHPLSSHDGNGHCSHAVNYGKGCCTCDNYLRAVVSLPEMVAAVLHTGPGRDASGSFYSPQQARLVARYVEALLDTIEPTHSTPALELLEGWRDSRAVSEVRWFHLSCDESGTYSAHLYSRPADGAGHMWTHSSTTSARDAASKAIMKANSGSAK